MTSTTCDSRKNRYFVPIFDRSLQPLLKADVLAGDVDVDEAAQVAVLGDPVAQAAVGVEDGVEHLADGAALYLKLRFAAGGGAQLGRDLHGDWHLDGYLLAELGFEAVEVGVDLVHLERIAGRVERLQTLAGDVDDDPLARGELAAFGQLAQDPDGDAASGLGEDPGRLSQQFDPVADLLVADRVDAAAGAARVLDRVGPVGGVADRQAFGDRLRPLRLADFPAFGEGSCDRAASLGLGAVEDRLLAADKPEVEPLLEAAAQFGEERAGGDRADHPVGQLPAELLDGLVGERLRALGVVGPQVDVDERPRPRLGQLGAEPVDVVVVAADADQVGPVDAGRQQLL